MTDPLKLVKMLVITINSWLKGWLYMLAQNGIKWLKGWLYKDELVKKLVICCANGHTFITIKVGYIFSLKFAGYICITIQSWLTSWPYCRYPGYILLTIHANMVI